ncbi:hypothetical protein EUX98_g8642 [Antrodiella citrinella]|uniref:LysM domain-containing protein n=1 Tax=Antrodiella citrinella TaxID=2447956 RepID=A0A4S4M692_9APHY|nr:hypothetical protein EUX98_g8642 [Antrodiella citrinella]
MRSTLICIAQTLFLAASIVPSVIAAATNVPAAQCDSPVLVSQSYIGNNNDVLQSTYTCSGNGTTAGLPVNNVSGAPCDTSCVSPVNAGPNPDDCRRISDALNYEDQQHGDVVEIPNMSLVQVAYGRCVSDVVNKDPSHDLIYSYEYWAMNIVNIVGQCQAQDDGGICVAQSRLWFIQVDS